MSGCRWRGDACMASADGGDVCMRWRQHAHACNTHLEVLGAPVRVFDVDVDQIHISQAQLLNVPAWGSTACASKHASPQHVQCTCARAGAWQQLLAAPMRATLQQAVAAVRSAAPCTGAEKSRQGPTRAQRAPAAPAAAAPPAGQPGCRSSRRRCQSSVLPHHSTVRPLETGLVNSFIARSRALEAAGALNGCC